MSTLIRYSYDATGVNPDNLVVQEPHTLSASRNRIFVPTNGPFFTESLKIYDGVTGHLLVRDVDFVCAQLLEQPTIRTGKEICAYVVVTNQSISPTVNIDYQALGGFYSLSVEALEELITTLQLDDRTVAWGEILGKPLLFNASHHFHDIGDVYGFEYVVYALDRIERAILLGDQALWDDLRTRINNLKVYVDAQDASLTELIDNVVQNHVDNKNNPHNTTAAQVGAYTTAQVDALINGVIQNLNNHVDNKNNPHNTTAAQVGAPTVAQMNAAISPVTQSINNHIADKNNPHAVTATQVGLGNVANYRIANVAEMEAGNSKILYATPWGITARINKMIADGAFNTTGDSRYVRHNANVSCSLRENNGRLEAFIGGAWRVVWPPQWQ